MLPLLPWDTMLVARRARRPDDIEAVRNFIVQSCLQWNTVNTYATYSMEEALGMIDEMEPIF